MRSPARPISLCLAVAALTFPAVAQAELSLVGGSYDPGRQFLITSGPAGASVNLHERTKAGLRLVDRVELAGGAAVSWVRWRCDRRVRSFVATAELEGGAARARYTTQTPSCRNRLRLRVLESGPAVEIADRWGLGARARLCISRPGAAPRCRRVRAPGGREPARIELGAAAPGTWRVELRTRHQVERRSFDTGGSRRTPERRLPLVLTVGDSMMQPLDTMLADLLQGRARPRSSVKPGSGLSSSAFDWLRHARREAARLRPDVTVIFLGTTDNYDMRTPDGALLRCCEAAWIDEYARRAAEMGAAYARGGEGRVLWLTLPAPRPRAWRAHMAAVNAALARAAAATPGAALIPIDRLVSPGFRFRPVTRLGARRVRLRAEDGIHLSLRGTRLAARAVLRAIRAG
jgi:hypothetical protein